MKGKKDNYQVYLVARRSVFLSPPNGTLYLLSPHLTRCYGLLRTVLFKLYVFRPYDFSFVVCPSVLYDFPPLVTVASSSCCPDLLRVFNYIVRVSKIAAYLLRGEMHMDFSSSNVDDCFNGAEERSSKDNGWIVLVFNLSECLICHLELNVCRFQGYGSE